MSGFLAAREHYCVLRFFHHRDLFNASHRRYGKAELRGARRRPLQLGQIFRHAPMCETTRRIAVTENHFLSLTSVNSASTTFSSALPPSPPPAPPPRPPRRRPPPPPPPAPGPPPPPPPPVPAHTSTRRASARPCRGLPPCS